MVLTRMQAQQPAGGQFQGREQCQRQAGAAAAGGGGGGPPWRAARPQTRLVPELASSPSLSGAERVANASGRGRVEGGALDCGPAPPPQAPAVPNLAAETHQGRGGGRCRRRRGAGREPSWCSTSVDCCSGWGWAAACGSACWVPVGRRQGRNGEGGGRTRCLVPMRWARAMVRRWCSVALCRGPCRSVPPPNTFSDPVRKSHDRHAGCLAALDLLLWLSPATALVGFFSGKPEGL